MGDLGDDMYDALERAERDFVNGTLDDYHAEMTREDCGDWWNCATHKDSFYRDTDTKYFTGIGSSRRTPPDIQSLMRCLGCELVMKGYTLRSGGADQADVAFETGALRAHYYGSKDLREIWVPWPEFNWKNRPDAIDNDRQLEGSFLDMAITIASTIHPAWDRCSYGARLLLARDVPQVLGADLDTLSEFVVLWAEPIGKKAVKGGSNMVYQIAQACGIPIYNLYHEKDRLKLERKWL